MPHFQVLRCYVETCGIFQSQQVKKIPKWQCKVCGEKQSVKRVYFDSEIAKDCRQAVQSLNLKRKDIDETRGFPGFSSLTDSYGSPEISLASSESTQEPIQIQLENSKWNTYVSEDSEPDTSYEPAITTDISLMETTKSTQRSRKRRIKDPQQSKYSRNKNQTQKYHSLTQPTDRPETPEQILPNPKENTRPHKFSHTHSKESKWNAYEENEDHSEDENTIHNPINDTTSKPNNMISKSSKWSTYMEEELDSDSDMPPTYAYSHIPQPRPPILSQTTANNDFSICSNDISSPTIFSQDTLVDTPPCKISTGTKAKLSKFAFVKKKSPIKPTLETTSPRKPDLPVEAQQQLYSSEDQVEYKKQENELNELDALEIEEFDPFNM